MKGKYISILILLLAVVAMDIAVIAREYATEAPAGFDTPTLAQNPGSQSISDGIAQPPGDTYALDQTKFEQDHDISTGLGPVFNARACAECHQNPVSGGSSQFTEVRAGPHGRERPVRRGHRPDQRWCEHHRESLHHQRPRRDATGAGTCP